MIPDGSQYFSDDFWNSQHFYLYLAPKCLKKYQKLWNHSLNILFLHIEESENLTIFENVERHSHHFLKHICENRFPKNMFCDIYIYIYIHI